MRSQPSKDQVVEFPVAGVDQSCEFSRQPPGTTPDARNVRVFDSLEERARGGSREGLSKLVDETLNGDSVIQHLAVLVDPTTAALAGTTIPSGTPTVVGPDGKLYRDGGSAIPVLSGTVPTQEGAANDIAFVQKKGTGYGTVTAEQQHVFDNQPAVGSGLWVAVGTYSNTSPEFFGTGVTVTNDAGVTYNQVGGSGNYISVIGSDGHESRLSLWYRRAASGVTDQTIRVTPGNKTFLKVLALEYSNNEAGPLDDHASNSETGTPTAWEAGEVSVGGDNELVLGFFITHRISNTIDGSAAGYTGRFQTEAGNSVTGAPIMHVIEKLGVDGPVNETPEATAAAGSEYVAMAVSIK